jgi:hypothetical protein
LVWGGRPSLAEEQEDEVEVEWDLRESGTSWSRRVAGRFVGEERGRK